VKGKLKEKKGMPEQQANAKTQEKCSTETGSAKDAKQTGATDNVHGQCAAQVEELTDALKRLQAEFENFKKWTAKEGSERMRFANAQLIAKFLPALDTFDASLKNAPQDDPMARGLQLVHAQLLAILKQEGLSPIECMGKPFDPHYHEVMLKEPSDKGDGTVLEEFQKGYLLHDRVLRHSKVKISGQ